MIKARQQTSFLFDLDGTLVDSVYDHVLAWHDALQEEGVEVSVWRLHQRSRACLRVPLAPARALSRSSS